MNKVSHTLPLQRHLVHLLTGSANSVGDPVGGRWLADIKIPSKPMEVLSSFPGLLAPGAGRGRAGKGGVRADLCTRQESLALGFSLHTRTGGMSSLGVPVAITL